MGTIQIDKPYLIVPKLIEQPTWGADFIVRYKNWHAKNALASLCIGQSYELSGASKLATTLTDSGDGTFEPEVMLADKQVQNPSLEVIDLQELITSNPPLVLGPHLQTMPLLIKFTQAKGNSFQLHIRPGSTAAHWKPKAESWYFFEKGYITVGLKKNVDISAYKKTCLCIEAKMKEISDQIKKNTITLEEGKAIVRTFIHGQNPWQFVNRMDVAAETCIDLSRGGIHHSWEEDAAIAPNGNIVYEVQQDVDDDASTIRSFDQGKLKDDGSIRDIQINDYFSYIDTDQTRNDPAGLIQTKQGDVIFHTPYYQTDELSISQKFTASMSSSFVHLFVKKGTGTLETKNGSLRLTTGHSCFIPWSVREYAIFPETQSVVVLKTSVP